MDRQASTVIRGIPYHVQTYSSPGATWPRQSRYFHKLQSPLPLVQPCRISRETTYVWGRRTARIIINVSRSQTSTVAVVVRVCVLVWLCETRKLLNYMPLGDCSCCARWQCTIGRGLGTRLLLYSGLRWPCKIWILAKTNHKVDY